MGFTDIGSLGHNSVKAAGSTITLSPSRNVPAGSLVVVWAASTGDGTYYDGAWKNDPWAEVEDDAGNVWAQVEGGLDRVSSDRGCYAIFLCQLTEPLTTSSVITVRARAASGGWDFNPKAISAWEFALDTGKVWATLDQLKAAREDPYLSSNPRGADISISSLPGSTEYLLLHALANNRPVSDSYSWDSDYTQIDADGTTGGADNSNITLRGGFRIATVTSDTVSASNLTGDSGMILQGVVAIQQVDYDGNFPTFPFLDKFSRPDQSPLPDPPWDSHSGTSPGFGTAYLRNISGQCAHDGGFGNGSMFLDTVIPAGDDAEIFATLAVVGDIGLNCFDSGSGRDTTLDGYGIYWIAPIYASHNLGNIQWGQGGFNGDHANAVPRVFFDRVIGAKFGMQLRESGSILHVWVDSGSGWGWVAAQVVTSFIHNGGKFGMNFKGDLTTRIAGFGGGSSVKFIPQVIRRWTTDH